MSKASLILSSLFLTLCIPGFFNNSIRNSFDISSNSPINISNLFELLAIVTLFFITFFLCNFRLSTKTIRGPVRWYFCYLVVAFISAVLSFSPLYAFAKFSFLLAQILIIMLLSNFILDDRFGSTINLKKISELWNLLVNLLSIFLIIVFIAYMISPAYQVGQYTLVLDRMAGGTWFYWGPNNLSQ